MGKKKRGKKTSGAGGGAGGGASGGQGRTLCHHCHEVDGTKQCSRCRAAFYCSAACQRSAWKAHKVTCTKPPAVQRDLSTATGMTPSDREKHAHMAAACAAGDAGNEDQTIRMLKRCVCVCA